MNNPYAFGYGIPTTPSVVVAQPHGGVQYAPQGIFGDILGSIAPVAGSAIGGALGYQQLGSAIGNVAGHLGGLIPFSAGPVAAAPIQQAQSMQYAPQGIFGNIVRQVAPVAGSAIGGAFGNQQLGSAVGNLAGHLGGYIPFSAGPAAAPVQAVQYAPQGLFGDIFSKVAPVAGSAIGSAFGNQNLGSAIGNVAGQLGGLIPFSAGPAGVQYAPQGLFGDIVSSVAPIAGNVIGGAIGQPQLGSAVGQVAGQLGGLIPFSAGPAGIQYAPQGLFGDIVSSVAPIAGNVIGGAIGQPQLGSAVGQAAGQLGGLIPFSAGPAGVQYASQGLFGDILGTVAPIAGTVLGGVLGQPVLGGMAGSAAGQAAKLLPFSAGPEQAQTLWYHQPQQQQQLWYQQPQTVQQPVATLH